MANKVDKLNLIYYGINSLRACPNNFDKSKPIFVENYMYADFSRCNPLYVTNLDTLNRYVVSEQKENESFVKGFGGNNGQEIKK